MLDFDDIVEFLETWQSLLQEVAIAACTFTDTQQVNLLLGALLIPIHGVLSLLSKVVSQISHFRICSLILFNKM